MLSILYYYVYVLIAKFITLYVDVKAYILSFYPDIYASSVKHKDGFNIYEYKFVNNDKIHKVNFIDPNKGPFIIFDRDFYKDVPSFLKLKQNIIHAAVVYENADDSDGYLDITDTLKDYAHYIINYDKSPDITWAHLIDDILPDYKSKNFNLTITLEDLSEIIVHSEYINTTIYEFIKKNN